MTFPDCMGSGLRLSPRADAGREAIGKGRTRCVQPHDHPRVLERAPVSRGLQEFRRFLEKDSVRKNREPIGIIEESAMIEEGAMLFGKFRPDEHIAEGLMKRIAESIEEEDDVERTRHFDASCGNTFVCECHPSNFEIAGFRDENIECRFD